MTLDRMPRIQLNVGTVAVFLNDGKPKAATVAKITRTHILFTDVETGEDRFYRNINVRKLFAKNKLDILPDYNLEAPVAAQIEKHLQTSFLELPEHQQLDGMRMAWAMRFLDRETRVPGGLTPDVLQKLHQAAKREFGTITGLSRANVFKSRMKWLASGGRIEAITPYFQGRGNRQARLHARVIEIIDQCIKKLYLCRTPADRKTVLTNIRARIDDENQGRDHFDRLIVPSDSAVRRRIKLLDPYHVTKAQYGENVARQRHGGFGAGERPTRPLELVEIDHTPLDIVAIDGKLQVVIGRVYLTIAIDKYSRCIIGFHIGVDKPSYLSVAKCLANAIEFKDYVTETYPEIRNIWPCWGIPQRILVDNGPEFHSLALEMACAALGVALEYAKVRHPHLNGTVERAFRKVNKSHFQAVQGSTFSNYLQLNGYNPERYTLATVESITEAMHILVIDVLNQEIHRELLAVPAEVHAEGLETYPPRLPKSQAELRISLGREEEPRAVWHYGVTLNYICYAGEGLARIRNSHDYKNGKKCRLKSDPDDLTHIQVQADDGKWIELVATNKSEINGLTTTHWKTLRRFCLKVLKQRIDQVGIARAIVRFREILTEGTRKRWPRMKREDYRNHRLDQALDRPETATETRAGSEPTSQKGAAESSRWPAVAPHPPDQMDDDIALEDDDDWELEYDE
ncbi:MAG: hypothetical protein E6Q98_08635 [Rhodospirillaceae bacterium]|nr:MAG: hypothetical protein E6Q98_08635 [Rhodospirillaceae bacterium]